MVDDPPQWTPTPVDGVLVFSQPGALPAASLEQVIRAVRELDMDEVRRQVAEKTAV